MASRTQQTRTGNKGVGGRLLGGLKHGRDRVEDGEALREVHDAPAGAVLFFQNAGGFKRMARLRSVMWLLHDVPRCGTCAGFVMIFASSDP